MPCLIIFLFCFFYWSPVVIHLFFSEVSFCRLCLDGPSRADGFSSYLEVDHRKWEPCVNKFTSEWVLLVFPFYESTCHGSLWFPIVIPSQVFPCPIVLPHIINEDSKSSIFYSYETSSRLSLFLSWSHLVELLPCYFMAFCSDLASFPQSK